MYLTSTGLEYTTVIPLIIKLCVARLHTISIVIVLCGLPVLGGAQTQNGVFSGPMIGEITPNSARIWLQMEDTGKVTLHYKGIDLQAYSTPDNHHIVTFHLTQLKPDSTYDYSIGTKLLTDNADWQTYALTTAPAPNSYTAIRLAAGSCKLVTGNMYRDPRRSKRRRYKIYRRIAEQQPDLMFWLGDFVYMRAKDHGDTARVYRRYAFNRALPKMQNLLQEVSHLALIDDHEFGPDDCDSSFVHKDLNKQAFKDYWANGHYGEATGSGLERHYRYDDLDFFLTDTRSQRVNPRLPKALDAPDANAMKRKRLAKKHLNARIDGQAFGPKQLQWLIRGLQSSAASFKFVLIGGQLLNNAQKTGFAYNSNLYHASHGECEALLHAIDSLQIKNVVFLSGDRHFSEVFEYETPTNHIRVLEMTYSGLSSPNLNRFGLETTPRRVAGSHYGGKHFGVVDITGPKGRRKLVAKTINKRGKVKRKYAWEQK